MDQLFILKWFPALVRSVYLFYRIRSINETAACLPSCMQGVTCLSALLTQLTHSIMLFQGERERGFLNNELFGKQSSFTFL